MLSLSAAEEPIRLPLPPQVWGGFDSLLLDMFFDNLSVVLSLVRGCNNYSYWILSWGLYCELFTVVIN